MARKKEDEVPGSYSSSFSQIQSFIENLVWKEIEKELNEWITVILDDLVENAEGNEIYKQQGRAQALKKVLLLPSIMLTSAELDQQRE